jgi:hypothetical protein
MRSAAQRNVNPAALRYAEEQAAQGGGTMTAIAKSEVKGMWFSTARRYILERAGEEALQVMSYRVDRAYRDVILEPLPSEWYPERALQQAMSAMHAVVAGGKDAVFVEAMEACTTLGIHHFFRALMRLGSPAYILRKTPAMWNHIRRGAGQVAVEADDRLAVIRYTEFPYFRDPNYRLLTIGAVRALIRICGHSQPIVEVAEYDWNAVTVRAIYG